MFYTILFRRGSLFHTNIGNSLEFCKLVIFVVFSRLDGLGRLRTVIHHIASKKYVYLPIPRTVRGYCQTKKTYFNGLHDDWNVCLRRVADTRRSASGSGFPLLFPSNLRSVAVNDFGRGQQSAEHHAAGNAILPPDRYRTLHVSRK